MVAKIQEMLYSMSNKEKSIILQRFFQTGKGQYGEGDVFIGVTIPQIRSVVKEFWKNITMIEIGTLLRSKIHEERMMALLFLVQKFEKMPSDRNNIVEFYLSKQNLIYVNNWDLVDASCYKILGSYLIHNPNKVDIIYDLSVSENMWERRISIVSTLALIKNNKFDDAIKISISLLSDRHHLICKAIGWMLREIGKKDKKILLDFLLKYNDKMSGITLSYAKERLTDDDKIACNL